MENTESIGTHQFQNDRIRKYTAENANRKIDHKTDAEVRLAISQGPEAIHERLKEIDKEWDIDRVLMLNFAVLVFAQLVAARKDRRWLWGPLIQTPFMFMHATLGWCPPSLWFRPMGFRTKKEIQNERETLIRALIKSEQGQPKRDSDYGAH